MIQQHKHTKGHHVSKLYQTGKYQLNKIETDDPLSPAPLNDNADKLEAAIQAEAAARAAGMDDLNQRVALLELRRIAWGVASYPTSSTATVSLGFTPKVVYACNATRGSGYNYLTVEGAGDKVTALTIIEGGFTLSSTGWMPPTSFLYFALA